MPGPAASIHDMAFKVMKHKADLFYHLRRHDEAASLYKKLLEVVPGESSCVARELRDGLAHSLLQIGEVEAARKEAEKLVT